MHGVQGVKTAANSMNVVFLHDNICEEFTFLPQDFVLRIYKNII
jgi:hypothetical protein